MGDSKIGILHPGTMGISLAACLQNGGHEVLWIPEGRSAETRARAEKYALTAVGSLEALCASSALIVSICPPDAAEGLASRVAAQGFRGLYLDANAISPQRTLRIANNLKAAGAAFVDGGIIGGPAWEAGKTWLYLAGSAAAKVAEYFSAGPLETHVLGDELGKAAALKMCYAAYTKGSTALLAAILGAAEELAVREALEAHWNRGDPDFSERSHARVRGVTERSWRYHGEMEEIAATFRSAGMPEGFHLAAAEIYRRTSLFKNVSELPDLAAVLEALTQKRGSGSVI